MRQEVVGLARVGSNHGTLMVASKETHMHKWHYVYVETDSDHYVVKVNGEPIDGSTPLLRDYLDVAGAKGWELVGVTPLKKGRVQLFLKRLVPDD